MKYIFLILFTFNLHANDNVENKRELDNKKLLLETKVNNKSLPKQLDKYLRADKVVLQGNDIYYYFTMTEWTKEILDVSQFLTLQSPDLIKENCSNKSRNFLEDGRKLFYIYNDKNNELFSEIVINKLDCVSIKNN